MMKLKHLFNNEDLATMILDNWDYDPDSLELFKYYRISANAVYPFRMNGQLCFLRFAPLSEKTAESVKAELAFIEYLNQSRYPAVEAIPSKEGESAKTVLTPWGSYVASVFRGVPGKQINQTDFSESIVGAYGESLGNLHKLSRDYKPENCTRWTWKEALEWIRDVLSHFPGQTAALKEAGLLKAFLSSLPADGNHYGLIHYDFETDNVFYDAATGHCHPIDFDDAMYHWFALDIDQALDSIREEAGEEGYEKIREWFLEGYRRQFPVSDEMLLLLPAFRRFANLFGYARIIRSIEERWENEPQWMVGLRGKLEQIMKERSAHFGEEIRA